VISNRVTPVSSQAAQDRPRDRRAAAVAGKERRVHAEDASGSEGDEAVPDELRPADDEDQRGVEPANGLDRLGRVDVRRLDQ
jgi:hypothetical protein